ncbi:hypothetical protein [Pseudocolwellia sp. HL-MZ7]|uniref:hypothetical protein n=1 Tax=Pseudocolwellia sp. HL-MZ7 TaxID=3400627 RepID=UPI003CFB402A
MKRFDHESIKTQVVSDFGMTSELYIETGNPSIDKEIDYPLFKVYANEENEIKYVELSTNGKLIQIPMSALKSFIEFSETEVHSEAWYNKNVFNEQ